MFRSLVHWLDTHRIASVAIVVAVQAIMLYPRFERHDISIVRLLVGYQQGAQTVDVHNYIRLTEYFRHDVPLDSVSPPFSYRALVPLVASTLPFDASLSVVLVCVAALYIGLWCLFALQRRLGATFAEAIVGCMLFSVSFPMFYYGSIGYVDAAAVSLLCAIALAVVLGRSVVVAALMLIAGFTKEFDILAFAVAVPFVLGRQGPRVRWRTVVCLVAWAVLFVGAYALCRELLTSGVPKVWTPSLETIRENVMRPKTYLSFVLSFGPVGVLALLQSRRTFVQLLNGGRLTIARLVAEPNVAFIAGMIGGMLLSGYSVLAAFSDGRYIWMAYPFMVPLAVEYLVRKEHDFRLTS